MSHACHELHGQHEAIRLVCKVLMHKVWYSYVNRASHVNRVWYTYIAKPASRPPCQRLTQQSLQHTLAMTWPVTCQIDSDDILPVSHQRMGFTPLTSPRQKGQGAASCLGDTSLYSTLDTAGAHTVPGLPEP